MPRSHGTALTVRRFWRLAVPLFSSEASLCRREAGEKEKNSARGPSSTARFLLFHYRAIFIEIFSGSLCGREGPFKNLNAKIEVKLLAGTVVNLLNHDRPMFWTAKAWLYGLLINAWWLSWKTPFKLRFAFWQIVKPLTRFNRVIQFRVNKEKILNSSA